MLARENPFSAQRIHSIPYLVRGWDWPELLARVKQLNYRAAIVGPEGTGKSTLLRELAGRLQPAGLRAIFIGLTREDRRFAPGVLDQLFASAGPGDLLCFDGSEQLNALAWRRFLARCRGVGGLLVTTHRRGRLPTLVACGGDLSVFVEIVATLEPGTLETRQTLAPLLAKHRGNVRLALRELYDRRAGHAG